MSDEAPGLERYVGETIAGRYRIDHLLGEGGMGAVFRAHHLGLRRDVAVKLLHPEVSRDPQVSGRFDREAQSASRLDHPNCIRVTDFGTWEPAGSGLAVKFMVMQYLAGGELTEILGTPLAPQRAVELMIQVLHGLAHAHDHGIIHRDIKPENIFVTTDHAGRETLKLVDFGIAKIVSGEGSQDQMTKAGLVFGTPRYMSPEQAAGGKIDERTDLYACGTILYQMLAGRTPFDGDDLVQLLRQQILAHPPPLPPSVDTELADAVYRLLAKRPDDRFETAAQVRDTLAGIARRLADAPAPAMPLGDAATMAPTALGSELANGDTAFAAAASMAGSSVSHPSPDTASFPAPGTVAAIPAPLALGPLVRSGDTRRPLVRRPSRATLALIGGGALAFAVVLVASRHDDAAEPTDTDAAPTLGVGSPGPGAQAGAPNDVVAAIAGTLPAPSAPAEALAELDRSILAEKWGAADKRLEPLLDAYPRDAQLLWRKGRLLARRKDRGPQALSFYGKALTEDPSLLGNIGFVTELSPLLRRRALRDPALDLALQHMGVHGHAFLFELIARDEDVLGYVDRHRALDALDGDEELHAKVDAKLHRALDLWQAGESLHPCATFGEALDAMEKAPDPYYVGTLEQVSPPKSSGSKDPVDASACDELPARLDAVHKLHHERFPDAARTVPTAYAKGRKRRRNGSGAEGEDGGGGRSRPGRRFLNRLGL